MLPLTREYLIDILLNKTKICRQHLTGHLHIPYSKID